MNYQLEHSVALKKGKYRFSSLARYFKNYLEKAWNIFALLSLPIGLAVAYLFPTIAIYMEAVFSFFIEVLIKVVPFVVPIILPPFIIQAVRMKKKGGMFLPSIFIGIIMFTLLAALFSSSFLAVLFGLPLSGGGVDLSFSYIWHVINQIPFLSPFLLSIYITIVFVVISLFNNRLNIFLKRGYNTLEKVFDYFDIVNPVIMFLAGGFLLRIRLPEIAQLPETLPFVSNVKPLTFYIYGVVLSGVIGFGFLLLFIIMIRIWIGEFNIKNFLTYLRKVAPFAFITSSEIATIPLNMKAVDESFGVEKNVRNTVIPIIGTLQSTEIAIVLPIFGVLASFAVGVEIPFLTLLIFSCTIFIIYDFVVVGVPSEVAILAVPLSQLLPIPDPQATAFIGIVIALQAGLSDSIRTVVNVVFGGLYSILMEKFYHGLKRRSIVILQDQELRIPDKVPTHSGMKVPLDSVQSPTSLSERSDETVF